MTHVADNGMTTRLTYLLLGVAAGLVASFLLDVIRTWRTDEASRRKIRSYLALLHEEIARRHKFINHYRKEASETDYDDEVLISGEKGADWLRAYFEIGLSKLRYVFDTNGSLILELSTVTGTLILAHYQGLIERIRASEDLVHDLPAFRQETTELIVRLNAEISEHGARSFFFWLRLWLLGRA